MKLTSVLLALAGCLILTGCDETPSILSIDAVVTDKDSKSDPALAGTWESADDKGPIYVIRSSEKAGYDIIGVEVGSAAPISFHAQLFRVGEAELLDLTPAEESDFRIPGHAFARIWTGGTLRWTFLHSDWLKQQTSKLSIRMVGDRMLLLSPGEAVRTFLEANAENEKAYGNVTTWRRVQ
jgi:hypothetical protein